MTTYILNLFDLVCTLWVMSIGVGELNSLFRDPHTIPVMIVCKVFVVGGLLWWLSKRTERIAHIGLRVCAVAYAAVTVWHIAGIAMILIKHHKRGAIPMHGIRAMYGYFHELYHTSIRF